MTSSTRTSAAANAPSGTDVLRSVPVPGEDPPRCSSLDSGPVDPREAWDCAPLAAGVGAVTVPAGAVSTGGSEYPGGLAVAWPSDPAGVGSNRSQPTPSKYSSGQACASLVRTSQRPWPSDEPAV